MVVEILMATYNGEKYLKEQINSIIKQTHKDWILSIRDDGSTDDTINILEAYSKKYKNIRILKDNKGNLGYKKNFEELLMNSTEEILFLCDQDDIWKEKKIEICLKKIGDKKVLHHNAQVFYEKELKELKEKELYSIYDYSKSLKNFYKPNFTGCCMVLKKIFLKEVLPIPTQYPGHDTWIGLLSYLESNIIYIDDKLINYRRHTSNVSFTGEKSKNRLLKKINYRYQYTVVVFFRYLKMKWRKR